MSTEHHDLCNKTWGALHMGENLGEGCPICFTIDEVARIERIKASQKLTEWADQLQSNEMTDPADVFILRRAAQIVRVGDFHA